MKGIRYVLLESNIGSRESYGIAAVCEEDGHETVVQSFVDVCSERSAIVTFVEKCNRLTLSLWHFYDAVEDFMAEL